MTNTILPTTGFMRLSQVLQFIPISQSTWYSGIKTGRFPQPVKLGPRTTVYRAEDIRKLIDEFGVQSPAQ
ncbi:AlpA family phage regulatory protein [Desulfovibrio sp.]|uniref:helix-turn-helix transcriptional regulator n=1 Tax=Desulfovibrio sp. TaxID=885 RepID=UPI0025C1AB6B|nr:AlpA family phage regulatory protein [Desulfovibrio sp.]